MIHSVGNAIEAGFWVILGLVFGGLSLKHRARARRRCVQAAVAFVAFGLSDVVEVYTGAWWRPWWLLGWKALCVLALAALLIDHWWRQRSSTTHRIDSGARE